MNISSKLPIDVVLCLLFSIFLLPIALLDIETTVRIILGLLFILFTPGYVLVFALFPTKKTDQGIDIIERIALSLCLSVAIVPLIGLALNYTIWGIQLNTILISIFIFIMITGVIAIYRWIKTKPEKRFQLDYILISTFIILEFIGVMAIYRRIKKKPKSFTIKFKAPLLQSKSKLLLDSILVVFIVIILVLLVYVIVIPKTGEQFTEFYVLGSSGIAEDYPTYLIAGENTSVILGIVNHEGQTINYTIEVWLIDQTTVFNETTQENESVYNHMWFIDKINVMLNHIPADIEKRWEPQWEYNYTFAINRTGENLKLQFLLFKASTEECNQNEDYRDIIAAEKINSAYRETHLWVTVF